MFGLSHGGRGKAAGLSLPHLCSVSSTRQERLGRLPVQELKQLGQRNGSDYKLCTTNVGKWGHTKSPCYMPPSMKTWLPSYLLEELRQHPLSKLWQGLGARGPRYRLWITLYHMMEVSGGLSTHINPQCCRSRSLAHTTSAAQGYGTAAATALGPSPVLAQHAVLQFTACLSTTKLCFPLEQLFQLCGDTRLLLLLLHASATAAQVTAGAAAKPPPSSAPTMLLFEVERRQQERCDCRSGRAAAALTASYSFCRLCIPPAAPEPGHCSHLGPAKPVPSGHAAVCWLSCLLTLLGRGNKEQGLSSSTGRLVKCAGWGCAWCGAGTHARCAHRRFPDQGSHTLFWPLPSLLSLQPIEGFVSLKSRFLTL